MIQYSLDRDRYYHRQDELLDWCAEHFGEQGIGPDLVWGRKFAFGTQFYYFKREEDAIMFALRWL
jgi:hypothetical protein